ncbi:hypothetical protein OBBRIDRAFT_242419 [Obba rivulosa]|uniref:F-box domain-containing protein n=1 Tax=Obba rivulosa TaxID=1052685 RepID=A0A8E2AQR6_9APHY|nr:hypothetical protein OBBRIDRAFT_242419 [Obba rivulosa]
MFCRVHALHRLVERGLKMCTRSWHVYLQRIMGFADRVCHVIPRFSEARDGPPCCLPFLSFRILSSYYPTGGSLFPSCEASRFLSILAMADIEASSSTGPSGGNPFIPPADGKCPINDLPDELLAHIFLLGTPQYSDDEDDDDIDDGNADEMDEDDEDDMDEDEEDDRRHSIEFEILVSHVCQRWRGIALDTPALWSTIDFDEEEPFPKAKTYLERSKGAPLVISVDCSETDEDEDDEKSGVENRELERWKKISELIIPHVAHWRTFELIVSDYRLMHHALSQLGRCPSAPMLEGLLLYHHDDNDDVEEFPYPHLREQNFVLFNGNTPKLSHVVLWGVHLNWAKSTFLRNLINFELHYHAFDVRPSYRDFARILKDSPDLKVLSLVASGPAGTPVDWLESITEAAEEAAAAGGSGKGKDISEAPIAAPITTLHLPSITDLSICYHEPEYILPLIERLALPNLTRLEMDFEDADFTDFINCLIAPHPVTGKPLVGGLEELCIKNLPCEKQAVADLYGAVPNLTSLNLSFYYLTEEWYHYLLDAPSSSGGSSALGNNLFLPRLTELITSGLSGAQMRLLVESRRAKGAPLKHVAMNQEDDVDEFFEEWLKNNVEQFETFEGSDDEDADEMDVEVEEDEWEDME